jgi:hypothetical protein
MKSFWVKSRMIIVASIIFLPLSLTGCAKASSSYDMPPTLDSSARYLFFLHGRIVEKSGPHGEHPRHGAYDYYGILKAFADRGFTVISEIRPTGTNPARYAEKVARQVETLLAAGVPPEHITVTGFSKGGVITLFVSARLGNPRVNFVVMAGCGKGPFGDSYNRVLRRAGPSLHGRFLSIYDGSDQVADTCKTAFAMASGGTTSMEIKLGTGLGHGLFYTPRKDWIEPVVDWINRVQP